MKINKSNYSLVLMSDGEIYEGTFNIIYNDKIFGKEIEINDTAYINEDKRKLSDNEKIIIGQIDKAIKKEVLNKGFVVDGWNIHYSLNDGSGSGFIEIRFLFGETMNIISFSLLNDQFIPRKASTLVKTISKRLLKELK